MIKISLDAYLDVYCHQCNSKLYSYTDGTHKKGRIKFVVLPCKKCLEEARRENVGLAESYPWNILKTR